MTGRPNRQAIYGPLVLERHVKDDGRRLLIYTLRHDPEALTGSVSKSS
jgi:hypothetical protein